MSGTLYPSSAPRHDPPASEVAVWHALRAVLPDGWTAWHSLRVRDGRKVAYEADFVVASPEFGLLVLEVKGGRVEVRDGAWHQNGAPLRKCPLEQARHAMHAIVRALKGRGVEALPPYGAAVVLPDTEWADGPTGGDLEGAVVGGHELPHLEAALRAVARTVMPRGRVPDPAGWVRAVHRLWGDAWVPGLSTRDAAARAARRICKLNEDQLRLLDFAEDNARAVVTGAAGTGKTLVARELCRRHAARGARVLYLCFTRALGAAMRRGFDGAGDGADGGDADGGDVRAVNVRQLAVELLGRAGRIFDGDRDDAWETVGYEAAEACAQLGERPYDLVVVDEAFDLGEGDWMLVDALCDGGRGGLWAFSDPRQHFWRDRTLPKGLFEGAARLTLPRQHRNPTSIERFAARYAPEDDARDRAGPAGSGAPSDPDPAPDGQVHVIPAPDEKDGLLAAVAKQVRHWRRQGAKPSDIAIVTLAGQTKSAIVGRDELDGEPLAPAGDKAAAERVVADTFLRFKGFERPFVIVTELGGESERPEYDTRMYIALTRATAELAVVCTEAERAADPRLG